MFGPTTKNFLLLLAAGALTAASSPALSQADSSLNLTIAEQDWLNAHPVIRLGIDPGYQPIEMLQDGKHTGLSREYIDLLSQKLGIVFSLQVTANWSATLDAIKAKKIDVLAALHKTPERETFLNFTDSYASVDAGIITSTHNKLPLSLEDLNHRQVAMVENYYFQDIIQENHPLIKIVPVSNLNAGLQEVAFGSVDALLATLATSTYYLQERGIGNLRVAGILPYPAEYRLGIRKDWTILNGILNKALASISAQQNSAIQGRWIKLHNIQDKTLFKNLYLITGVGVTLFLLLLLSALLGYKLRKQVRLQTQNLKIELGNHKLTQKELNQSRVELELRVEERTEELNETIEALFRTHSELEKANHQLSEMANNDGLTKIANRRHLDLALALALGSTQENRLPLTFILGDIDYFKPFNDHYGHQAGDHCLYQIAQCLNLHTKRSGELAARYGGEEFALLLPGVNNQEAKQTAEHIIQAISDLNISHARSPISSHVSISLGVVSIVPTEKTQTEDLIRWADEALYAAKKSGRNCLRFASPASIASQQDR